MSDLLTRAEGEVYGPRSVPLTPELTVLRVLPQRARRLVGAWCFLDHFRAVASGSGPLMRVAPHPHVGLQTVTWLFDGEVRHRDSLGRDEIVRPGELNVMTAGAGISHAETSLDARALHGLQLWIALPDASRATAPAFEHHTALPVVDLGGARARVLLGELAAHRSPAIAFSALVGLELTATRTGAVRVPLHERFEHAVIPIDGDVTVASTLASESNLVYLAPGRGAVEVTMREGSRAFVVGGEPLGEDVLIWWNFVARTHEEMVAARDAWEQGDRFGIVPGFDGERIPAPPITMHLRP